MTLNKTKQTAVDWIQNWMSKNQYFIGNDLLKAFEQAKEMELKQRIDDYNNGHIDRGRNIFNEPKQINNEQTI